VVSLPNSFLCLVNPVNFKEKNRIENNQFFNNFSEESFEIIFKVLNIYKRLKSPKNTIPSSKVARRKILCPHLVARLQGEKYYAHI